MAIVKIKDLADSIELDRQAMTAITAAHAAVPVRSFVSGRKRTQIAWSIIQACR